MRPMFRIDPALPAAAYKSYEIHTPVATHWRPATCAEVGCQGYEKGWSTAVDEATDLGQRQAHYIRRLSGRGFTEVRNEIGLTVFTFAAGQRCFRSDEHKVRLDRPELYVVRDGDWRGNPTGRTFRHARAADWVDDFATHQLSIADSRARG